MDIQRWQRASPTTIYLALAVVYAFGSCLAYWTIEASGLGAVFFPPAGLTFAALLTLPADRWPFVVAAIVTGEIFAGVTVGGSDDLPSLFGFAAANSVEPLVGVALFSLLLHHRVGTPLLPDLGRRRPIAAFAVAAVGVAPIAGAAVGSATAWWRFDSDVVSLAPQWWLGDALGVLVVAPLFLVWFSSSGTRSWRSPMGLGLVALSAAVTVRTRH